MMKQDRLKIQATEELTQIYEYLKAQNEPDELMNLIRNPQFEFDLNLSSRMLNYHESNGFIRFHREGTAGKRRFSLANALGFQFSMYLKGSGLNNTQIAQLNEILYTKDKNGVTDWDRVVYMGSVTMGISEIYVKMPLSLIPGIGDGNEIELSTKANEKYFFLSKTIREIFFNGQGHIQLKGKTASFLPNFVYQIDKVRNELEWDKISPNNFKLVEEFGDKKAEELIDSNAVKAINNLPIKEYLKMYDVLYRDEKGDHFGIEIKFLRLNSNSRFRSDKVTTNLDELFKAIEEELMFIQKMREKLYKVK